jgi:hypothetical protein
MQALSLLQLSGSHQCYRASLGRLDLRRRTRGVPAVSTSMFIDASMPAITFLHRDHQRALSCHHVVVVAGGSNRAGTQSKCLAWTARCLRCRRRTTRHTHVTRVRGTIRHGCDDVGAIGPELRHRRCGPGRPSPSPRTSRGHNPQPYALSDLLAKCS